MTEISLTLMTKMRHVRCKMLSLRKTKSLNTPCSPRVYFGKKSDSTIQTDFLSERPNTIRIEPVDSNRSCLLLIFINRNKYETNRHFLSKKYNAFCTYNLVYILI